MSCCATSLILVYHYHFTSTKTVTLLSLILLSWQINDQWKQHSNSIYCVVHFRVLSAHLGVEEQTGKWFIRMKSCKVSWHFGGNWVLHVAQKIYVSEPRLIKRLIKLRNVSLSCCYEPPHTPLHTSDCSTTTQCSVFSLSQYSM